MKRLVFSMLLAASLSITQAASAANPASAKNFIDGLAIQVLSLVKSDSMSKSEKQAKVEALFADKVDINFVAKFVLASMRAQQHPSSRRPISRPTSLLS